MLQPGTVLDNKYQIEAVIGRGGFGYVYLATERLTGETVAIKELTPVFAEDREMAQRFIQEARATLRLTHPSIVRTYSVFRDRATYYLAMEYMARGSLGDRLERGALPTQEALGIAVDLCAALEYAHSRGVIHCDIKPANVLFDEHGDVRLTDFGIAHVSEQMMTRQFFTGTGEAMGTVRYMAPEQLEGVRDEPRIDVYAIGALLYEMLAGQPYLDFETENTPGAQARNITRIQSDRPRPLRSIRPRLPEWLIKVVDQALHKAPGGRFASVRELRQALLNEGKLAPREYTPAMRAPISPPPSRPSQERYLCGGPAASLREVPTWVWAVGGLALLALLVSGAMLIRDIADGRAVPLPTIPAPHRQPSATPTIAPTDTRTSTPTSTPSLTRVEPTPTHMATLTPTPTRTSRPTHTPTRTPSSGPTRRLVPVGDKPRLVSPIQGQWVVGRSVTFQWQGTLRQGQAYRVVATHVETQYSESTTTTFTSAVSQDKP
jgi:serine/threonine protein kinase